MFKQYFYKNSICSTTLLIKNINNSFFQQLQGLFLLVILVNMYEVYTRVLKTMKMISN